MSQFNKAILVIVGYVLIACVGAMLHTAPFSDVDTRSLIMWLASIACFGLLLGGIAAFDADSDLSIKASAAARITIGSASALLLASIWRWPYVYWALAGIIGAILGHLGMLWAKYVDF